jgi:hypothetical protein
VPSDILVKCIVISDADTGRNINEFNIGVISAIESASVASALSGFRFAWGISGELLVQDGLNDLAVAAASSDIAMVGRLLGPRDVNTVCFSQGELPESLVRRPLGCSLLDVAVGSGSVEMAKYLFEFHGAKATRETLKQSISAGNLELFRMVRERLPEGELRDRVDLMEVAAEFHQEEVLTWLHRDATVFERELLGVFALERKLADSLVVALENGIHPWWGRTREVSLKWRASSEMEFAPAPEGFSTFGGWRTSVSGATSALRGLGGEGCVGPTLSDRRSRVGSPRRRTRRGPTLPDGRPRVAPAVEFEWTKGMSRARLGETKLVKSVVFPVGVTAIGEQALYKFEALESVVFTSGCVAFGEMAFAGCKALKAISLPVWCKAIGMYAFLGCESLRTISFPVGCKATGAWAPAGCSSLVSVTIPTGCSTISCRCFSGCTSLTEVRFPNGLKLIELFAFFQCGL